MAGERRALIVGTLALLGLATFVALRLRVTSDIAHFLPEGHENADLGLAREVALGELARTLVVLVDATDEERAVAAGRALEQALRAEPRVRESLDFLDAGPPEGVEQALWSLYQPRRLAFLAPDVTTARARTTDAGLDAAVARLSESLAGPLSGLVSRVAPSDPFLVLPELLERISGEEGLALRDGRFVTADGRAAVLFLGTRAPATDAAAQRPFLAGVEAASEAMRRELGDDVSVSISGAQRYAVRAEEAIKRDVRRVSLGSALGLAAFLLLVFGSLRLGLLVLPVIGGGFLAGASACLILFGSVHGITLAFGAAMIGVSIDYAVHFHCHHTLAPEEGGARSTLRRIWIGLALSAATTAVGFLALTPSRFPGLRELAVFGATGIAGALAAARVFLPGLAVTAAPTAAARALVAGLDRWLAPRGAARWRFAVLPMVVLAATAVLLPRARWNDDFADLGRLDPELVREDEAMRARVVRYETRRIVVAPGADDDTALEVNARAAEVLDGARADGLVGGVRSLAPLLPSRDRQRAVDAAVRGTPDLFERLATRLEGAGFRVESFEPFRRALEGPAPDPLTYADLAASPLAPLARPFRVSREGSVAYLSFLEGLADEEALRTRLEAVGARLLDVQGVIGGAYGAYRRDMLRLLSIGLVLVLALVTARHRAPRPVIAACAPALLSGAGTVGVLALLGVELNLLTLVALLLVVGLGVDYGVLLAETRSRRAALRATHFALVVSAVSTAIGFGMLSASDQPALFSIGSTAAIGVLLCLVLAPSISALLAGKGDATR